MKTKRRTGSLALLLWKSQPKAVVRITCVYNPKQPVKGSKGVINATILASPESYLTDSCGDRQFTSDNWTTRHIALKELPQYLHWPKTPAFDRVLKGE